jgi:hypothetical protein
MPNLEAEDSEGRTLMLIGGYDNLLLLISSTFALFFYGLSCFSIYIFLYSISGTSLWPPSSPTCLTWIKGRFKGEPRVGGVLFLLDPSSKTGPVGKLRRRIASD